jgi:hypothetical protein
MKRREAFMALGCAGVSWAVRAALAAAPPGQELTEEEVAALLRSVARVEPRPGEAALIRQALSEPSPTGGTDPRVQPALVFDPEVEL